MILQVMVRHRGFYLSALNFCWNLSETVPQRQWKPKVCWQTLTAMTPRMRTTTRTKMAMNQSSTSNLISTIQKVVDDANARGPLLEFVLVLKQKLSHSGWCCIPTNCFSPPKTYPIYQSSTRQFEKYDSQYFSLIIVWSPVLSNSTPLFVDRPCFCSVALQKKKHDECSA